MDTFWLILTAFHRFELDETCKVGCSLLEGFTESIAILEFSFYLLPRLIFGAADDDRL